MRCLRKQSPTFNEKNNYLLRKWKKYQEVIILCIEVNFKQLCNASEFRENWIINKTIVGVKVSKWQKHIKLYWFKRH